MHLGECPTHIPRCDAGADTRARQPSRNEYLVVLKAPAHGNVSFDEGWDDSLSVDAIQPNMDGLGAVCVARRLDEPRLSSSVAWAGRGSS